MRKGDVQIPVAIEITVDAGPHARVATARDRLVLKRTVSLASIEFKKRSIFADQIQIAVMVEIGSHQQPVADRVLLGCCDLNRRNRGMHFHLCPGTGLSATRRWIGDGDESSCVLGDILAPNVSSSCPEMKVVLRGFSFQVTTAPGTKFAPYTL